MGCSRNSRSWQQLCVGPHSMLHELAGWSAPSRSACLYASGSDPMRTGHHPQTRMCAACVLVPRRQGLEALDNAALEAGAIALSGGNDASAAPAIFTGLGAPCHQLCRQIISHELNQVVADLLLKIKGFQDRAMLRDPTKVRKVWGLGS